MKKQSKKVKKTITPKSQKGVPTMPMMDEDMDAMMSQIMPNMPKPKKVKK